MPMDFILNGKAHGSIASMLLENDFDPGMMRPWIGKDGRTYVARRKRDQSGAVVVNDKGSPVYEAVPLAVNTATLRKDEWKQIDRAVIRAATPRLRAFSDLRAQNLTYGGFNALGHTVLQYEDMSDINDASISMDGLSEGAEADRPVYDLKSLPLPIVSKRFHFSARQLQTSRNVGAPIDTTMAELAARKVAEKVEELTLGTAGTYQYGGGYVYGYTNFPNRLTKTITAPTDAGWNGATCVEEVLQMRQQSIDNYFYGPWMLYFSGPWAAYLDDDYSASKGDNTLRERLKKIDGIIDVRTLDKLTGYQIILVQMTSDVVRAVVGMDVTTIQWETQGGMQINFLVMAILVPQLRSDQNDRTGIVHGSA